MRTSLSLKLLLRAPVKTLLTFLLLTAAAFALFSRISEYAITSREIERAVSRYRGVAALDNGLPDTQGMATNSHFRDWGVTGFADSYPAPQTLTAEQIAAFRSIPQVSSVDARYMTAGISQDGYFRLDVDYDPSYNYVNRFIAEGVYRPLPEGREDWERASKFQLHDVKLLVGDPSMLKNSILTVNHIEFDDAPAYLSSGYSLASQRCIYYIYNNPFGSSFRETLTDGGRYLIVGRWEPRMPSEFCFIGDQDTMSYCTSFWELDGLPEDYLGLDEFAPLRELIEITESDLRTFDMVYTSDMLAIPRFAEKKMVIAEGRALTAEDDGTANCVISAQLAQTYKLKQGDTIALGLCGKLLMQDAAVGAVSVVPERYSPPMETALLTIVGIYQDTDTVDDRISNIFWGYSPNTIFVPQSLLPVGPAADYAFMPGEYSFVVGDASDIGDFLKQAEPLAEELGLTLRFDDGGWGKMRDSFNTSRRMSLLTTVMFIVASIAALMIALWLHIGRGKKNFAIMRALGTPLSKARSSLLIPFGLIFAVAVSIGAAGGLIFTSLSAASTLEGILQSDGSYMPDVTLPYAPVLLCLFGMVAFTFIAGFLFMRRIERTPPLMLLQAGVDGRAPDAVIAGLTRNPPTPTTAPTTITHAHAEKQYAAFSQVAGYILRNMHRKGWKTALSLLLAVLICGTLGIMIITVQAYDDLFANVKVTAYHQFAASDVLVDAGWSALFEDVYYRAELLSAEGNEFLCNETIEARSLLITNDVERFLTDSGGAGQDTLYIEGFGGILEERRYTDTLCVIGSGLAEDLDLSLGDSISVCSRLSWDIAEMLTAEIYPEDTRENEEVMREYEETFRRIISGSSGEYVIGGIADSPEYSYSVFAPVGSKSETIMRGTYTVSSSEFILVDNSKVEEAEAVLKSYETRSRWLSEHATIAMDTAERDSISNILALLNVLFPFAVVAAILIGMLAPVLFIAQTMKETAIMRALGATKRRVWCIVFFEQATLSVAGVAIALIGLMLYNFEQLTASAGMSAICLAAYLLAGVCAIAIAATLATRRNALDLLQVKE